VNYILIGYRAAGKTSVGQRLALLLGRPFYDTDDLVRRQTGRTVKEIVSRGGWPAFRAAERAAVAGLASREGAVIALGGGAVLDPANVEALKPRGVFIWLQAGEETIRDRLAADRATAEQRPSLLSPGEGGEGEILRRRIPLYGAVADLAVDTTGLSIDEVAGKIKAAIESAFPFPSPNSSLPRGEKVEEKAGRG